MTGDGGFGQYAAELTTAVKSARPAALRVLGGGVTGLGLYLIRQQQVGHAAGVQGMFDCQRGQFRMVAAAMHGGSPGGDVAEDGGQVEILEGSSPQDRRRHLAGDRQDR